jgi:hypothetical protein
MEHGLVAVGSICPVQAAPLDWIQTESLSFLILQVSVFLCAGYLTTVESVRVESLTLTKLQTIH